MLDNTPPRKPRFKRNLRRKINLVGKDKEFNRRYSHRQDSFRRQLRTLRRRMMWWTSVGIDVPDKDVT